MLDTRRKLTASDFAIRIVHVNNGWRYWAFKRSGFGDDVGDDLAFGLRADGYESRAAAERAIAKAVL